MADFDCYSMLGVSRGATEDEIKRARRNRLVAVHPDRLRGASAEDEAALHAENSRINHAAETLLDPDSRHIYDTLGPFRGALIPKEGAAGKSKTQLLKELQDSLLKEKLDQIEDEVRGGGRIVCNIDAVNFVNPLEGRPQEWPELTSWISQHSFSLPLPDDSTKDSIRISTYSHVRQARGMANVRALWRHQFSPIGFFELDGSSGSRSSSPATVASVTYQMWQILKWKSVEDRKISGRMALESEGLVPHTLSCRMSGACWLGGPGAELGVALNVFDDEGVHLEGSLGHVVESRIGQSSIRASGQMQADGAHLQLSVEHHLGSDKGKIKAYAGRSDFGLTYFAPFSGASQLGLGLELSGRHGIRFKVALKRWGYNLELPVTVCYARELSMSAGLKAVACYGALVSFATYTIWRPAARRKRQKEKEERRQVTKAAREEAACEMRQLKDQAVSRRRQQREMEPAGLEIQFGMYGKLPSSSELKQLSQQQIGCRETDSPAIEVTEQLQSLVNHDSTLHADFDMSIGGRLRGVYDPCPSTPQHEKHVYLEYTLGGEAFEKTFEIDQPIIVP